MNPQSLKGTSLLAAVVSLCAIGVAVPGHTAHHPRQLPAHAAALASQNEEAGCENCEEKDKEHPKSYEYGHDHEKKEQPSTPPEYSH